ncbi:MAG: bifunctional 4-hydroxy-2-oxoglutarate aldolase/2-dehydro-3-deoxy-phosphogluconate aldolase [Pseudanabaenaceae cyanobacterium]
MSDFLSLLHRSPVVAVIRTPTPSWAIHCARCAREGGIVLVEISWQTPQVEWVLEQLGQDFPDLVLGAGTLTTGAMVKEAVRWGSRFLFSPVHTIEVIAAAQEEGVPIVAGATTPTEIFTAWQRGATAVKVFPVANLGGVSYIKALQPVFPHIPLIPTGGVTLENAQAFLQAGALAVGLATDLFPPPLVQQQNWQTITDRIQRLMQTLVPPP